MPRLKNRIRNRDLASCLDEIRSISSNLSGVNVPNDQCVCCIWFRSTHSMALWGNLNSAIRQEYSTCPSGLLSSLTDIRWVSNPESCRNENTFCFYPAQIVRQWTDSLGFFLPSRSCLTRFSLIFWCLKIHVSKLGKIRKFEKVEIQGFTKSTFFSFRL